MVSVLRTLYCDPTGELTVEGITRTMKFGGGSGQGKILAPRLFSFYLYAIFKLWMAEHPDALQSLLYQHDGKMTGRKCTEEGLPLRYCLFNLADDTALIFATKMALILHGFALIRLLRDFGLDTHLSTDANPAPKTAAMCVHPRSVLNYLRECAARHRAKETAQPTVPRTFASCPEPPLPIEIIPFDDGAYVPIVENYIYVGANVAETLLCDIEVHRKIRSASSLLGFLRPRVFGPHTTAVIVKRTVYESMVLGVLLYGSECWILTSKLLKLLENFHHRAARTMNAVTLYHTRKHCLSTSTLLHRLGLSTMQDYLDKRTLGWAGHVARMPPHRWPRKMLSSYLPYPRPLGAPQKTYGRSLTAALTRKGVRR
jgi:hypothetical protein